MKTNSTPYLLKLSFFLLLAGALVPKISFAQQRAVAYLNNPVVYINLMLPSADSLLLVDGTGALFSDKYSDNVDEYDAGKLSNFNENICLFRNGQKLAIEARAIPKQNDTLFIHMWGMMKSTYTLQINTKAIFLLLPVRAWLIDNYLHTQTQLNLFGKTLYNFRRSSDTTTYSNRFMIVFERNTKQENNTVNASSTPQLANRNITVYPNPVTGNKLSLHFTGVPKDKYSVRLSSLSGETLSTMNILHAGNDNEYYLPLKTVYIHGIYTLTILGVNTGKIIHLPVVVN